MNTYVVRRLVDDVDDKGVTFMNSYLWAWHASICSNYYSLTAKVVHSQVTDLHMHIN